MMAWKLRFAVSSHVLDAFANGATSVPEILPVLIRTFDLTPEDVEERLPSGSMTVLANRTHWARTYMSKAGLLTSPKRGRHEITQKGCDALARFPERIDNDALMGFEGFETWRNTVKTVDDLNETGSVSQAIEERLTPEDRLSAAFAEIEATLVSEVLDAIRTMQPVKFEKLVIDLLLAMGYGGGALARGRQTRLSGDGGIDGIVNEDELGLDAIYIQAKRYAAENKVDRPALNAFVGSLTGEGATKGVFVTTSDFTQGAVDYVERVQHRIVLINGDRLARLMIRHEVGVRARQSYIIRSVDEDYFSDT
jgi:restriction system protein